jgi:hypothetical protein
MGLKPGSGCGWHLLEAFHKQNKSLQALCMSCLGFYTSIIPYFVVTSPETKHANLNHLVCNSSSYRKRGWCRLELWARMAAKGPVDAFVFEDNELVTLADMLEWYCEAIKFFQGEFTVPADKEHLVDTVLALWFLSLTHHKKSQAVNQVNDTMQFIHDLVQKNKEDVFPEEYFGPLIAMMKDHIDGTKRQADPGVLKVDASAGEEAIV